MPEAAKTVQDIADRFWARVDRTTTPDGCWPWTGGAGGFGYGRLRLGKKKVMTHRVAWELTNGPIPEGILVLHDCDNPPCCRPDHLFLGDHAANVADRHAKGRTAMGDRHGTRIHPESLHPATGDRNGARTHPEANWFVKNRGSGLKGEANPTTKLSDAQVEALRADYAADPVRGKKAALARKYGITKGRVSQLIKGNSRREVTVSKKTSTGI
jgi:hypothetical protein